MKRLLLLFAITALSLTLGCAASGGGPPAHNASNVHANSPPKVAATNPFPVIHVFVALCDNVNQGIVPVSASLGNGDNPNTNLYWGAAFGVKTFFSKNKDWEVVSETKNPASRILDRVIFKRKDRDVFMIADAYQGKEIAQAMWDFFDAAAGAPGSEVSVSIGNRKLTFNSGGSADLVVYVGHDGLMDFNLQATPKARDEKKREAIMLACASKNYFAKTLEATGAKPLLWTTNLMAPEAYILSAAIEGWLKKETDEAIRARAARAYNSYQNCGLKAANGLFATGW
ncbi:MAG TPA: hypothetical protein VLL54_21530 [Pyrinomonadaceae bacterium]|nr:hypothetical protein [Pyrinomonadaceae bacterium]